MQNYGSKKMFKWLSDLFKFRDEGGEVKIRLRDNPINPTTQEDPRTQETIKRVRKAFKEQERDIQVRALKPHSAVCKDPLACKTKKCFKWEPDKIVGKPYTLDDNAEREERRKRQRLSGSKLEK